MPRSRIAPYDHAMPTKPKDHRRLLRQQLRRARAAIATSERRAAAKSFMRHASIARLLRAGTKIALYLPMRDEADPGLLLRRSAERSVSIFLPRIGRGQRPSMNFAPLTRAMRFNRFGIPEPAGHAYTPPTFLDVIFLPIVGFDAQGTRLGMGGGYYDRALAFRLRRRHWRGPKLIGLAYDAQQTPALEAARHDVQLDGILTESGIRWFYRPGEHNLKYWLMKTEPGTFSIDDLGKAPKQTTGWDGVRNYQVRNMLRDDFKVGDQAFIYHSSCEQPGIVGIAEVVKENYADPTQFDPKHDHYDPKSSKDAPRWLMVDVKLVRKFASVISLDALRTQENKALADMLILRAGNRLSITPVDAAHWKYILKMEGSAAKDR